MTDTSPGMVFERSVSGALSSMGIKVLRSKDFTNNKRAVFSRREPFAVSQGEYRNFCDKVGKADFILYTVNATTGGWRQYRLECRYQSSPGSVSEKLPKLLVDAAQNSFERTVLIASPWLVDYYTTEMQYLRDSGVVIVRYADEDSSELVDFVHDAVSAVGET